MCRWPPGAARRTCAANVAEARAVGRWRSLRRKRRRRWWRRAPSWLRICPKSKPPPSRAHCWTRCWRARLRSRLRGARTAWRQGWRCGAWRVLGGRAATMPDSHGTQCAVNGPLTWHVRRAPRARLARTLWHDAVRLFASMPRWCGADRIDSTGPAALSECTCDFVAALAVAAGPACLPILPPVVHEMVALLYRRWLRRGRWRPLF